MADSDGFLKFSKKIEKTKILPLRWIGNLCGGFAGDHIMMASYLHEDNSVELRYRYHSKMYRILNKPYEWWGTYYIVDTKAWSSDSDSLES